MKKNSKRNQYATMTKEQIEDALAMKRYGVHFDELDYDEQELIVFDAADIYGIGTN